jgi:hypothetical protein
MSVARAQREVDSAEFAEWMAFDRIDPIGDDRQDVLMAIAVANITGAWGGKRKPKDFMPQWRRPKQRQTGAQMAELLRQWGHWFKQSLEARKAAKGGK